MDLEPTQVLLQVSTLQIQGPITSFCDSLIWVAYSLRAAPIILSMALMQVHPWGRAEGSEQSFANQGLPSRSQEKGPY